MVKLMEDRGNKLDDSSMVEPNQPDPAMLGEEVVAVQLFLPGRGAVGEPGEAVEGQSVEQ